jgi:hypothetical protein
MAELETKIESIKATSSGFEGRTEAHERHFGVVKASHSSIKDPPPGLFIATFVIIEEGGLSFLCIRMLTAKGCPWAKACSTECPEIHPPLKHFKHTSIPVWSFCVKITDEAKHFVHSSL